MICFEFVEARVSFCQAPSTSLGNCSSLPIGEQKTVYCWGSQCCLKCVRLPGLVFLLSPVLSPSLSHLDWDAASASLVLSLLFPVLSPPGSLLSGVHAFLVCLVGLSPFLSPILSSSWSGMPCLWSGLVSRISCAVCATVWGHMVV